MSMTHSSKNPASLSLKPDKPDPIYASRAAWGAMMSAQPPSWKETQMTMEELPGDGKSSAATSGTIKQVKSKPMDQDWLLNGFWVTEGQWRHHHVHCDNRRRCEEMWGEWWYAHTYCRGTWESSIQDSPESMNEINIWVTEASCCAVKFQRRFMLPLLFLHCKTFGRLKEFTVFHKGDANHVSFPLWKFCGCLAAHMCTSFSRPHRIALRWNNPLLIVPAFMMHLATVIFCTLSRSIHLCLCLDFYSISHICTLPCLNAEAWLCLIGHAEDISKEDVASSLRLTGPKSQVHDSWYKYINQCWFFYLKMFVLMVFPGIIWLICILWQPAHSFSHVFCSTGFFYVTLSHSQSQLFNYSSLVSGPKLNRDANPLATCRASNQLSNNTFSMSE